MGGVWRMDGPKLRPETSTSIEMGDSGWGDRCLYHWTLLVCSSWAIQRLALFKFLWSVFPGRVPVMRVQSVVAWVIMLPMLSLWDHLVEAIWDSIFECSNFLFSRFHLHSIQRRIDPRKIWNSFTKIDIINISKVFLPL